jgi:hypothetical protein
MAVNRKYKPGINQSLHETLLLLFAGLTMVLLFMKIMFF